MMRRSVTNEKKRGSNTLLGLVIRIIFCLVVRIFLKKVSRFSFLVLSLDKISSNVPCRWHFRNCSSLIEDVLPSMLQGKHRMLVHLPLRKADHV